MSTGLRAAAWPSQQSSTIGPVAVAFSWAALILFGVLLPFRFVFVGAIVSAPFFGQQPDAGQRAMTDGYFLAASSTATGVAVLVLVITLLFRSHGSRLVTGWIVSSLAAAIAGPLWLLAIIHIVSPG